MKQMNKQELIYKAKEVRKNAYAPYSNFLVGAALLTKSGKIYTGCNIENAAYSSCICGERTALFKAVSDKEKDFVAMAIVGGKKTAANTSFCPPCGACRQVMREFCQDDFLIILEKDEGIIKEYTLKELLPESFKADYLEGENRC